MSRPGTDPLSVAAGRLDWYPWPPAVAAAVEVLAAEVDHTGDLPEVVAILARGFDVLSCDLADAAVELAAELRYVRDAK